MISIIKEILSIILLLIFFGSTSSIALQKTSKWIKREAIVKVHKGLSPLSGFTNALTSKQRKM